LDRGNKLEKVIWDEFSGDPVRLRKIVATIRSATVSDVPLPEDTEAFEAREGRVLTRLHTYRERDRTIVKRKKAAFIKAHGRLFCEACAFDFSAAYGTRGNGFIECHHTKPISELKPEESTHLADLALLCANCHRMIHATRPWWTMEELRAALS
jgi:5-methylcytosine-specific restriction protein A